MQSRALTSQMYGCGMIPIPGAIGNGNRKSRLLPCGDRLRQRTFEAPQSVKALRSRTVIHEGELKALLQPLGLPDHGGR